MSYTDDLEEKIFDLEARLNAAEKSLRLLAWDYSKQRAVNEALLVYVETQHQFEYGHTGANELAVALREALK